MCQEILVLEQISIGKSEVFSQGIQKIRYFLFSVNFGNVGEDRVLYISFYLRVFIDFLSCLEIVKLISWKVKK